MRFRFLIALAASQRASVDPPTFRLQGNKKFSPLSLLSPVILRPGIPELTLFGFLISPLDRRIMCFRFRSSLGLSTWGTISLKLRLIDWLTRKFLLRTHPPYSHVVICLIPHVYSAAAAASSNSSLDSVNVRSGKEFFLSYVSFEVPHIKKD